MFSLTNTSWDITPDAKNAAELKQVLPLLKLISLEALIEYKTFPRCQDIPNHQLVPHDQVDVIFALSHRWKSREHPDPQGDTLRLLQKFLQKLEQARSLAQSRADADNESKIYLDRDQFNDVGFAQLFQRIYQRKLKIGVFIDFCSLPQYQRTAEEEDQFKKIITNLVSIYMSSHVIMLMCPDEQYFTRAWCLSELYTALHKNSFIEITTETLAAEEIDSINGLIPGFMQDDDYLGAVNHLTTDAPSNRYENGFGVKQIQTIQQTIHKFKNREFACSYAQDYETVYDIFKQQIVARLKHLRYFNALSKLEF